MHRGVTMITCISILLLIACAKEDDDEKPKTSVIAKALDVNSIITLTDDIIDPKRFPIANQRPSYSTKNNAALKLDQEPSSSLLSLQQLALKGTVADQLNYARALLSKGAPYYDRIAFYWTEQAAQQQNAEAQFMLAYLHLAGIGTPVSYEKAHALLYPLAKADVPQAQFYLAKMYFEGLGVEKNITDAKKWISLAMQADLPEAKSLATHIFAATEETDDNDQPEIRKVSTDSDEQDVDVQDKIATDGSEEKMNTIDPKLLDVDYMLDDQT